MTIGFDHLIINSHKRLELLAAKARECGIDCLKEPDQMAVQDYLEKKESGTLQKKSVEGQLKIPKKYACPECGKLLHPRQDGFKWFMECVCGYTRKVYKVNM